MPSRPTPRRGAAPPAGGMGIIMKVATMVTTNVAASIP